MSRLRLIVTSSLLICGALAGCDDTPSYTPDDMTAPDATPAADADPEPDDATPPDAGPAPEPDPACFTAPLPLGIEAPQSMAPTPITLDAIDGSTLTLSFDDGNTVEVPVGPVDDLEGFVAGRTGTLTVDATVRASAQRIELTDDLGPAVRLIIAQTEGPANGEIDGVTLAPGPAGPECPDGECLVDVQTVDATVGDVTVTLQRGESHRFAAPDGPIEVYSAGAVLFGGEGFDCGSFVAGDGRIRVYRASP